MRRDTGAHDEPRRCVSVGRSATRAKLTQSVARTSVGRSRSAPALRYARYASGGNDDAGAPPPRAWRNHSQRGTLRVRERHGSGAGVGERTDVRIAGHARRTRFALRNACRVCGRAWARGESTTGGHCLHQFDQMPTSGQFCRMSKFGVGKRVSSTALILTLIM